MNKFKLTGGVMKQSWYVVANQKEVNIYTESGYPNKMKLVRCIMNPLANSKKSELLSHKAGMSVKSLGGAGAVFNMRVKRTDPKEAALAQFAKEISEFLNEAHENKEYESLIVAAEPHFMGKIKAAFKAPLKKSVEQWINKDLQKLSQKDLAKALMQ